MRSFYLHIMCTDIGAMNLHAKEPPQPLSHATLATPEASPRRVGEGGRKAG